jgi:hypothetical protein
MEKLVSQLVHRYLLHFSWRSTTGAAPPHILGNWLVFLELELVQAQLAMIQKDGPDYSIEGLSQDSSNNMVKQLSLMTI